MNITPQEVQNSIAAFEKLNDPFSLGISQFAKEAELTTGDTKKIVAAIAQQLETIEKQAAVAQSQVSAFINSVESELEKAGASNEQITHAWVSILQRMGL